MLILFQHKFNTVSKSTDYMLFTEVLKITIAYLQRLRKLWKQCPHSVGQNVILGTPHNMKTNSAPKPYSTPFKKVSLHELKSKKISLHMMVTHEHHFQPLFGNIKRKFNGFQI